MGPFRCHVSDRFPWFPFYASDWRLSKAVRAMTPEQRGAYIELLCVAWDDGLAEPSLPDDERQLAALSGLGKRWRSVGAPVRECFDVRDGRLYNVRLTHVWEVQRAKYEIAVIAGKASAAQRERQRKANGRSTGVARTLQRNVNGKSTISDADTERTKSATRVGALTDGALASLVGRKPA